MSFLKDFLDFLKTRKKLWLIPLLLVMGLLGGLAFLGSHSAAAPFIYTLF